MKETILIRFGASDKAPAISREEHSSYCSAQSIGAPALNDISRDMEQNSEDSQATKRSAEIHSGEVERAQVSSAQAARKAKLFCVISTMIHYLFNLLDEGRKNSMTPDMVIKLAEQSIYTIIIIAAPMLLIALGVGLLVSVFQAMTQIQEQTLAFIPKILAVFISLVVFGPWMLTTLLDYTRNLFQSLPRIIG